MFARFDPRLSAAADPLTGGEQLSDPQFERIARLAQERYGLHLPARKRYMVANRLAKMRRSSGCATLDELVGLLEKATSQREQLELFDVLSTNLTHFFREAEHLDTLQRALLASPPWTRLRIWSAGCSKGCEPYSISMMLLDAIPELARRDVKLLATDFSTSVLHVARQGVYPAEMLRDLDPGLVERFFEPAAGDYRVRQHVRAPITFALLNLMEPWRMRGPFDSIFCSNVMIYFNEQTREQLTRRFSQLLRAGGLLFLGSSESLTGIHPDLLRIAPSSYRKTG